jgi:tetratricopeptide (TPR) repeat protein
VTVGWALPLVIVMQTRSAGVSPRPVAWAAQSPRPAACQGAAGLWEVSRLAVVGRRCRELSRAQALLLRAPDKARERAQSLLADAPDLVEARVLRGRASLRLGDAAAALADLLPLLADDAGAVSDPSALLDGGRAALAQKDMTSAARFYRALGSRAALLPDRSQQLVAYIEIAAALLASETAPVDDVLAYLREARRRAPGSGFTGLCAALTAVAWTAQGREAEGQGALSEVTDPDALARFETREYVWLPDGLFHAVMGLVLERARPEVSATHYQALAQSALAGTALGKLGRRARSHAPSAKSKRDGR